MALVVADRVKETTNSTGTGSYALGGASPGFQAFSVVTSNADTVYYSITDNVNYEVGIGAYASSGNSISRTTIFSSSNSNNAVNWGIGTKDIFLTYPADKAVIEDVSNNVTIGNNLIVGGTVDGVDIQTLNTTANAALPKAGGTMSGNLILNADPTAALQSATKQYVDTIAAAGIHYHQACRAETTANLNATYSNGSSGVGATLTNAGTQAAIVVDGVTLSATNRVMVQLQTNQAHNGVYTVTTVGSASTNWVLTRATDADSYSPSDPDALGEGDAFFITEGTVHGGELDVMTTTGVITFGTTNIVFALVSDAPIYTAGTGLSISGTEFSLVTPVSSATALATGRTIGMTGDVVWTSASFDGTGNVTGTATIQENSVALGTDTTGNYVGAGATSGTGISGSLSAEGGTFTVASNATNANTASTIVARDGSGNFSAGTVTGALSGNASTATALATGRTIGMTGDVVWTSASFDGTGNVTGIATIQPNSVALGTDTTGNYVSSIANGSYLTGGGSASENKAYTLGVDATSANTASKVVARDSSGNFTAGTVTAALSGNASSATALATGRNINGVFFNGTANITVADSTKLPKAGGAMTGAITTNSTFDGRDVSVDGTKLDTIATSANNYSFPYTISQGEDVNSVARRTSSGYLFSNYFNGSGTFSTSGITSGMGRFTGTNGSDTYGRSYTAAAARGLLNVADGANNYSLPASPSVTNLNVATSIIHTGDTNTGINFDTDQISIAVGGSTELYVNTTGVRLGDSGNGYFQPVSGNYGSIQIDGGAHGGWEGYSIGGRSVFMHDNNTVTGIYNDVDNEWFFQGVRNAETTMYYNGSGKFSTTSGGAIVYGTLAVNGTVDGRDVSVDGTKLDGISAGANNYSLPATPSVTGLNVAEYITHTGDTDTYMRFQTNNWGVYTGGSVRLNVNNTDTTFYSNIQMSGHHLDMNNNDIYGVDQIFHEGDTNTYMQFHAADQWRVVCGGNESLEVRNQVVNVPILEVGGTDVISNSRQLQNIASIDSTTAAAITAAGVGGISSTMSQYNAAFSRTGANLLTTSAGVGGTLSTSVPNSAITFMSHTISSSAVMANVMLDTGSSGITTYVSSYYGVAAAICLWNGFQLSIKLLTYTPSSLSNTPQLSYIQGMGPMNSGLFLCNPGDVVYGVILGTYHPSATLTGGASWGSYGVVTQVTEVG